MKEMSITIKDYGNYSVDIQIFHWKRGAIFYRYYPKLTPEISIAEFIGRIILDLLKDDQ